MKRIELTQNKYVLIDDEDYSLVSQYKWRVVEVVHHWYVITGTWNPEEQSSTIIFMHRLIMNAQPGELVDHRSHYEDFMDNRKTNLKICTQAELNDI